MSIVHGTAVLFLVMKCRRLNCVSLTGTTGVAAASVLAKAIMVSTRLPGLCLQSVTSVWHAFVCMAQQYYLLLDCKMRGTPHLLYHLTLMLLLPQG